MAAVYALLAALSFGTGDFFGGFASRRHNAVVVSWVSQIVGGIVFGVVVLIWAPGEMPDRSVLLWAAAAGVALGAGYLWYYRGLSIGQMGVVATDTAVWAALVPVATGFILGERPLLVADLGILIVLSALALLGRGSSSPTDEEISGGRTPTKRRVGRLHGTVAGVCYGFFFVFLDQTGAGNPLWSQVTAIAGSILVLSAALIATRRPLRLADAQWPSIIAAGVIQSLGFLAFIMATRTGFLSIVAVLAALSPIPTTILARVFLHQRLTGAQTVAVIGAIMGVALVTAGSV